MGIAFMVGNPTTQQESKEEPQPNTEEVLPILVEDDKYSIDNMQEEQNMSEENKQEEVPFEIGNGISKDQYNELIGGATFHPVVPGSTELPQKEEYESKYFKTKTERNIFSWFIIPPVIISIISAYHLIDFFNVGNTNIISTILSLAFEISTAASLVAIIALKGLKRSTRFFLWIVIFGLYTLQFIGNIFSVFSYITNESAKKMLDFFSLSDTINDHRIISYIVGGIMTIVAFSLTKIASDYIRKVDDNNL
jgi:hypothetical protein